jgi:hypothetical protein
LKIFLSLLTILSVFSIASAEVIRIDIGKDKGSSQIELERRVWSLERAVRQLQDRIYDLESDKAKPVAAVTMFTCQIESFGKMFSATEPTKMAAKAKVLKECADATNAIHCEKDKVECGN